jgi:hypothetical protein
MTSIFYWIYPTACFLLFVLLAGAVIYKVFKLTGSV